MSDKSDRRLVESHAEFVERIDACEQEMEKAIDSVIKYSERDVPEMKCKVISGTVSFNVSVGVSYAEILHNTYGMNVIKQKIRSRLAEMLSDRAIEILLEDLRKSSAST